MYFQIIISKKYQNQGFLIFCDSVPLKELFLLYEVLKSMNKIFQKYFLDDPVLVFRLVAILKCINKSFEKQLFVTLIWVGFSGVCFAVRGGGITASLSKTCQNYARNVSTHMQIVLESIPLNTKIPLILLISACFCKTISIFFVKNSAFTQNNIMRAVLEVFEKFYRPCVQNLAPKLFQIRNKLEKC